MNSVVEVLVRIRDELDALIVGLIASDEKRTPATDGECEHKHTQVVGGLGKTPEYTVCVDCLKEL